MTDNLNVVGTELLPGAQTASVPPFPMSYKLLLNKGAGHFLAVQLNLKTVQSLHSVLSSEQ